MSRRRKMMNERKRRQRRRQKQKSKGLPKRQPKRLIPKRLQRLARWGFNVSICISDLIFHIFPNTCRSIRSHNPIACQVAALDQRSWTSWPPRLPTSDPGLTVPSSCTLDKRVCMWGGWTTLLNSRPVLDLGRPVDHEVWSDSQTCYLISVGIWGLFHS